MTTDRAEYITEMKKGIDKVLESKHALKTDKSKKKSRRDHKKNSIDLEPTNEMCKVPKTGGTKVAHSPSKNKRRGSVEMSKTSIGGSTMSIPMSKSKESLDMDDLVDLKMLVKEYKIQEYTNILKD